MRKCLRITFGKPGPLAPKPRPWKSGSTHIQGTGTAAPRSPGKHERWAVRKAIDTSELGVPGDLWRVGEEEMLVKRRLWGCRNSPA